MRDLNRWFSALHIALMLISFQSVLLASDIPCRENFSNATSYCILDQSELPSHANFETNTVEIKQSPKDYAQDAQKKLPLRSHTFGNLDCASEGEPSVSIGEQHTRVSTGFDSINSGFSRNTLLEIITIDLTLTKEQPSCFEPGDAFSLEVAFDNPMNAQLLDFYCVLDVYGSYFWYPSWTEYDKERMTVSEGASKKDLLSFLWPAGAGRAESLRFLAALTSVDAYDLQSNVDIIVFCFED